MLSLLCPANPIILMFLLIIQVLDGPIEGLSHEEMSRFLRGDVAFSEVFTRETGLGPTFVATSCISCHAGDGKGHPFTTLTRFGQSDETGNLFFGQGGPQLQNSAFPGYMPEQIPFGATLSKFTPPANTGLGFLQFVTDAEILAMADPDDVDGDGISGVPNWIDITDFVIPSSDAISQDGKYIGRFGKKAAAYSLLHQTANAYNQDMGITSIFRPIDAYTGLEIDPEVGTGTVNDVVFYLQTLKAPVQRNKNDAVVIQGANICLTKLIVLAVINQLANRLFAYKCDFPIKHLPLIPICFYTIWEVD